MYSKVEVRGKLQIVTGIHIGTGGEFSAIGAADSPVIREPLTGLPMIPGSSLKGKIRSLLARKYNTGLKNPDGDDEKIRRLFGEMKKSSRLIFSDMALTNMEELKADGIYTATEIKFENTINRASGVANPRQIERAIRGCEFDFSVIYNADDISEMTADFRLLAEGMTLLQYDYLGGHGSRGYGKVKFADLTVKSVVGDIPADVMAECQDILQKG